MDLCDVKVSDPEVGRQIHLIVEEMKEKEAQIEQLQKRVDSLAALLEEHKQQRQILEELQSGPIPTKLPPGLRKAVTEAVVRSQKHNQLTLRGQELVQLADVSIGRKLL